MAWLAVCPRWSVVNRLLPVIRISRYVGLPVGVAATSQSVGSWSTVLHPVSDTVWLSLCHVTRAEEIRVVHRMEAVRVVVALPIRVMPVSTQVLSNFHEHLTKEVGGDVAPRSRLPGTGVSGTHSDAPETVVWAGFGQDRVARIHQSL